MNARLNCFARYRVAVRSLAIALCGVLLLSGLPVSAAVKPADKPKPGRAQTAPLPDVDSELRTLLVRAFNQAELRFADAYDAEAWMMAMSSRLAPYVADEKERLALLALIRREANLAGLKPEMVMAVIEVESKFDRFAVSRTGAQGMMQVMPFWKNEIGRPDDNLTATTTNLRYGCTILKYYLDKENGNLRMALADYNGSSVYGGYPDLVFRAYQRKWKGGEL